MLNSVTANTPPDCPPCTHLATCTALGLPSPVQLPAVIKCLLELADKASQGRHTLACVGTHSQRLRLPRTIPVCGSRQATDTKTAAVCFVLLCMCEHCARLGNKHGCMRHTPPTVLTVDTKPQNAKHTTCLQSVQGKPLAD
jgi:hypothetical protein